MVQPWHGTLPTVRWAIPTPFILSGKTLNRHTHNGVLYQCSSFDIISQSHSLTKDISHYTYLLPFSFVQMLESSLQKAYYPISHCPFF